MFTLSHSTCTLELSLATTLELPHATTLELLYQLPGEPDFGHGTKVVRRVQMAGPFAPGTLVRFCTHAANSTDDSVFSEVRQVGVPA